MTSTEYYYEDELKKEVILQEVYEHPTLRHFYLAFDRHNRFHIIHRTQLKTRTTTEPGFTCKCNCSENRQAESPKDPPQSGNAS